MEAAVMESFQKVRDSLVRDAVSAAEQRIVQGCLGNREVLMPLTAEVAAVFAEKTRQMLIHEVWKRELFAKYLPSC